MCHERLPPGLEQRGCFGALEISIAAPPLAERLRLPAWASLCARAGAPHKSAPQFSAASGWFIES
jgi:hypothetical protein